jgi:hypothetical protein
MCSLRKFPNYMRKSLDMDLLDPMVPKMRPCKVGLSHAAGSRIVVSGRSYKHMKVA